MHEEKYWQHHCCHSWACPENPLALLDSQIFAALRPRMTLLGAFPLCNISMRNLCLSYHGLFLLAKRHGKYRDS